MDGFECSEVGGIEERIRKNETYRVKVSVDPRGGAEETDYMKKIWGKVNPADHLTKAQSKKEYEHLLKKVGGELRGADDK